MPCPCTASRRSEGRELFTLLLGVNGVGTAAGAGGALHLTPDAIRRAVFHEQAEVFARVPGVGKQTAQKILLYLAEPHPHGAGIGADGALSDVDGEVLAALATLGYSVVEAQSALQTIPRDAPQDVERACAWPSIFREAKNVTAGARR